MLSAACCPCSQPGPEEPDLAGGASGSLPLPEQVHSHTRPWARTHLHTCTPATHSSCKCLTTHACPGHTLPHTAAHTRARRSHTHTCCPAPRLSIRGPPVPLWGARSACSCLRPELGSKGGGYGLEPHPALSVLRGQRSPWRWPSGPLLQPPSGGTFVPPSTGTPALRLPGGSALLHPGGLLGEARGFGSQRAWGP